MDKIEIEGIKRLEGKIKISGSKNSSLPILASSLLVNSKIALSNVPRLTDVYFMLKILESLNCNVSFKDNDCEIIPTKPKKCKVSYDLVRKMRASFLVLGPLLAKYGSAVVSLPGGCAIGTRPVDLHLDAFKRMGAKFTFEDGYVRGEVSGKLIGCEINLRKISVGATENIMIAATLAEGITTIKNAAREPEICDLGNFLIALGANISGLGTKVIKIHGKTKLNGCNYKIMPDRIEAGTFALCVMGCSGRIVLENVNDILCKHLIEIFGKLELLSIEKLKKGNKLLVYKNKKKKFKPIKISTKEFPGFPTDLQAQLVASLLKSEGKSVIEENIFENRFMHVSELKRMGGNLVQDGSKINVRGVEEINGAEVMATDLRASSSLIIAGLMAKGKTTINRVYHLDRGYENLEDKLKNCGVNIKRISE